MTLKSVKPNISLKVISFVWMLFNIGCFFNARIYDENKSISTSLDGVDDTVQPPNNSVPTVPVVSGLVSFSWPSEGSSVYGYQSLSGTCIPNSTLDVKYDAISSGYYSTLSCSADGRFELPTYFSGASALTSVSIYQSGTLAAVRNLNYITRSTYVSNEFDRYVKDVQYANAAKSKIYAAGDFDFFGNIKAPGIIRFNIDGTVDNTFNVESLQGNIKKIFVHPVTNKVFVFGRFTHINGVLKNSIALLNTDGSLDTSFSPMGGITDQGNVGNIIDIAIDSVNSKLYLAGEFDSVYGQSHNCVVRINFDGSLDASFNAGSGCGDNGSGYLGTANAVEWDSVNSKVYVGGWLYDFGGNADYTKLVRLNSDGTLDLSFSQSLGGPNSTPFDIKYDPNLNKTYVAGVFTTYNGVSNNGIVRINSDGTADAGFVVGAGFSTSTPWGMHVDASSRLIIYGKLGSYKGVNSPGILRILSNGTIDPSWNMLSSVTGVVDSSYMRDIFSIIYDEALGSIFLVGAFSAINGTEFSSIAKISINGTLDTSYMDIIRPFNGVIEESLVDPVSGDVYVLGEFTKVQGIVKNGIARLNSDGTLDTGFDVGTGFNSNMLSMYFDSTQQKLYVYGGFTTYQGVSRKYIVRLNNDGSFDSTFNIGTSFPSNPNLSFAFDPINQKIYLTGNFSSFNGNAGLNKMIRLNLDATIDNTFVVGSGFNATPGGVLYAGNGKIYVFGDFTTYKGASAVQMIRINPDGSRDGSFNYFSGVGCDWDPGFAYYDSIQERIYISFTSIWANCNGSDVGMFTIVDTNGNVDSTYDSTSLDNEVWRIIGDGSGNVFMTGYFYEFEGKNFNGSIKFKSDRTIDLNFKPPAPENYFYSIIKNPIEGSLWFFGKIIDYPNNGYIKLNNDDGSFAY
jgi:uncharacterized delta-60 repeat protein